jgi:hypothetical protein
MLVLLDSGPGKLVVDARFELEVLSMGLLDVGGPKIG